jgi:hypothetical protein
MAVQPVLPDAARHGIVTYTSPGVQLRAPFFAT